MKEPILQRKLLALVTGGISILIGIIYLLLIFVLDARGPMLPPPPEAFGEVGVVYNDCFLKVPPLFEAHCL